MNAVTATFITAIFLSTACPIRPIRTMQVWDLSTCSASAFSINGSYKTSVWSSEDDDEFFPRIRSMYNLRAEYKITPTVGIGLGYVYYRHCFIEPHFVYNGFQGGLSFSF